MISYKFMRALVIFDLPVISKTERKIATAFRKFLLDDGFEMLQYSVYTRLCIDRDNANMHLSRIEKVAPKVGSVRVLMVTEHQYSEMSVITGQKTVQENKNLPEQLAFF